MSDDLFVDQDDFVKEEIDAPAVDDPVIREIPIILRKKENGLVVLQYPTRKTRAEAQQIPVDLKVKEGTQWIESDIPVVFPETHFDHEKAERWGKLDSQVFGGLLKQSNGAYALAKLNGDALELVPVPRTAQLRPQFHHYNRQLLEDKEATKFVKETKPSSSVRAVQMSAKAMGEQAANFSKVLDFWRENSEEQFVAYPVAMAPTDPNALAGDSNSTIHNGEDEDDKSKALGV